jgi:hypothetical protein
MQPLSLLAHSIKNPPKMGEDESGEFVEKQNSTVVGQTRVIKGDSDVLG